MRRNLKEINVQELGVCNILFSARVLKWALELKIFVYQELYKWALESVALLALNARLGCLEPTSDKVSCAEVVEKF
jgi:hypothetical protein